MKFETMVIHTGVEIERAIAWVTSKRERVDSGPRCWRYCEGVRNETNIS